MSPCDFLKPWNLAFFERVRCPMDIVFDLVVVAHLAFVKHPAMATGAAHWDHVSGIAV